MQPTRTARRAYQSLVRQLASSPDLTCDKSRDEIKAIIAAVGLKPIELRHDVEAERELMARRRVRFIKEGIDNDFDCEKR